MSEAGSLLSPHSSVVTLGYEGKTLHLLGTAHVSEASVREVREAIDTLDPDVVCVELDQGRYDALVDEGRWKSLDVFKVLREGKALYLLATLALSAVQRRMGDKLGVRPGAELLEAAQYARARGKQVELIDRDVHITLKRTWANLSFFDKAKLMAGLLEGAVMPAEDPTVEQIEELKASANLSTLLDEFSKALPQVKGPLIDERDRFMVSHVREAKGPVVLAVVGAAHVPGMQNAAHLPVDRAALNTVPPPAAWVRALKWVIPALILGAFAFGWSKQQGKTLEEMLYAWILPNSILCALFTSFGLAKLPSIITGFFVSPITSLNPLVPAGLVVGLVEAWLRRPTVHDAETIHQDVQSLKGFYRNRFLRVLLVAALSTIGSAMGAWVGLGWVLTLGATSG